MSTQHPHEYWMEKALQEAAKALHVSDPNPRVGCVILNAQGELIGAGHTQAVGQAHAEVMALRDVQERGFSAQKGTAYVTLEPCSHHGRTPPCTTALIEAGVQQIIIAATDPNPVVYGQGISKLQAAGIDVTAGVFAQQSKELNIGFFKRMQTQLPWVRLKMASSLDGKIALNNGKSQWITGQEARADGHVWRARASCVLTGVGTVLADDPQLNVRAIEVDKQPWHAMVDTHLRTPRTAQILQNIERYKNPVLIYTASLDKTKREALIQAGAIICHAPLAADGHLDPLFVLKDLARRECNELHVEAGGGLSSALLKAGLVDELLVYMAPRLVGKGQDFLQGIELDSLSDTLDFHFESSTLIGDDLRFLMRKKAK